MAESRAKNRKWAWVLLAMVVLLATVTALSLVCRFYRPWQPLEGLMYSDARLETDCFKVRFQRFAWLPGDDFLIVPCDQEEYQLLLAERQK